MTAFAYTTDQIFDMTKVRQADCPKGSGTLYFRDDLPDGVAQWHKGKQGENIWLDYVCPCGCKNVRSLLRDDLDEVGGAVADVTYGCGWKGKIVGGEWVPK